MSDRYFEDFKLGDSFTTAGLTLTEGQIIDFALRWDPYPFHTDVVAAEAHHFGGLVASGFHTLSVSFRLFNQSGLLRACAVSGSKLADVRFLRPVRPGDTLHGTAQVRGLRPSRSRAHWGTLTLRHRTFNQHGEIVMSAMCDHIVSRRPEPDDA